MKALTRDFRGPCKSLASLREEGTETVVFIDRQRMTRECIGERLAGYLPEWLVLPISGPEELGEQQSPFRASVMILNVHHLGMASSEVAEDLKDIEVLAPGRPIIIMSERSDPSEVTLAFKHGVRGYISASMAIAEAVGAIRLVAAGGTYVPAIALDNLITAQPEAAPSSAAEGDGGAAGGVFSPRELHVLGTLQQGKPNKVIAYELGLAESTVKVHIRHIMKKLNARNRTQVVLMTRALPNTKLSARGTPKPIKRRLLGLPLGDP